MNNETFLVLLLLAYPIFPTIGLILMSIFLVPSPLCEGKKIEKCWHFGCKFNSNKECSKSLIQSSMPR